MKESIALKTILHSLTFSSALVMMGSLFLFVALVLFSLFSSNISKLIWLSGPSQELSAFLSGKLGLSFDTFKHFCLFMHNDAIHDVIYFAQVTRHRCGPKHTWSVACKPQTTVLYNIWNIFSNITPNRNFENNGRWSLSSGTVSRTTSTNTMRDKNVVSNKLILSPPCGGIT